MHIDENGNAWWDWLLGAIVLVGLAAAVFFTAGAAGIGIGAAFAAGFTGTILVAGVGGSVTAAVACGLLSSAFAGAVVTAGLGVITGGLSYESGKINWDWNSASEGFGYGALFGAFSGAAMSNYALGRIGKGFVKQILQMGINSMLSGAFTAMQGVITNRFDWGDVILAVEFGSVSGVLGATIFNGKTAKFIQTLLLTVGLSSIESIFSEIIEYIKTRGRG